MINLRTVSESKIGTSSDLKYFKTVFLPEYLFPVSATFIILYFTELDTNIANKYIISKFYIYTYEY